MQKEKQTGLFAAPLPSQVPFAHLAGLERPGWGRSSPRLPLPSLNPPEQPPPSGAAGGNSPPELPPAPSRSSPEEAEAEPAKLGCGDPNSAFGANPARRTCLGAGAASGRRAGGSARTPLSQLDPCAAPRREIPAGKAAPGDAVAGAARQRERCLLQLLRNLSEQDFIELFPTTEP